MNRKLNGLYFLAMSAVGIGVFGAGCDKNSLGDLPAQCGLVCPDKGVVDGNAAISGNAGIDGFFTSAINFSASATTISDSLQAELDGIATSLGLKAGASSADIKAALDAKLSANVTGSLKIAFQPPECSVSAKATIDAEAKCDASVMGPTATAQCSGSCNVDAGVKVDCGANATLSCTGTAPSLSCSGTCKGECDLTTKAACSGTCHGDCDATCSVKDANGKCAGTCSGNCTGSCQLDAAATCTGQCKGSCTYTAPAAGCDASAQAHCDAKAGATVDCKASCTGSVTPPSAKADCQASAKANASVSAQCTPPSLNVSFQLAAGLSATDSANFTAWLEGFKGHVSNILALQAKIQGVASAAVDISGSASADITAGINADIKTGTLKDQILLACAIPEVPKAIGLITDAGTTLTASAKTAADVLVSVGIGS